MTDIFFNHIHYRSRKVNKLSGGLKQLSERGFMLFGVFAFSANDFPV